MLALGRRQSVPHMAVSIHSNTSTDPVSKRLYMQKIRQQIKAKEYKMLTCNQEKYVVHYRSYFSSSDLFFIQLLSCNKVLRLLLS